MHMESAEHERPGSDVDYCSIQKIFSTRKSFQKASFYPRVLTGRLGPEYL